MPKPSSAAAAAEALIYLTDAAQHGKPDAQFELGELYRYGQGVPMDCRKALDLYFKSARRGGAEAQYQLGFIFSNGLCETPKNDAEALGWYTKAAKNGQPRLRRATCGRTT